MKNTDLIIFSGQSNMQGETGTPPLDTLAVEKAFEYRFCTDELVPLKHQIGEAIDVHGNSFDETTISDVNELLATAALLPPVRGGSCMIPAFCRTYIEKTGRNVVAAHCTKGSTEIEYWQKDNIGYKFLSRKVKGAIEASKPENIYFVWLQGESDAIFSKKKDYYKEKLTALKDALKADFNIEKFGVILVGRFTMDERDLEIINAQKEACEEDADFLMLTTITEELIYKSEYMNPTVKGHYNAKGQDIIGTLAGEILGEYVSEKNS